MCLPFPKRDLEHLASDLKSRLKIHVMRVVGDPKLQVRKVALVPGASGFAKETRALEISDLQVLITGEAARMGDHRIRLRMR